MGYEQDLIERLVIWDPVSRSTEGLDDECMFCGAFPGYPTTFHRDDCPWIEGMRFLGRELPAEHDVESNEPEREYHEPKGPFTAPSINLRDYLPLIPTSGGSASTRIVVNPDPIRYPMTKEPKE